MLYKLFIVIIALVKSKVWIDCDPGDQDALAIIYAMFKLDVLGISTTYGEYSIQITTDNAVRIMGNLGGFKYPLISGSAHPFLNETCSHINNDPIGMFNGTRFDVNFVPIDGGDPIELLRDQLEYRMSREKENTSLILLAPHTNFGVLFHKHPEILKFIKQVIIVGGDQDSCELNFKSDPDASQFLIDSLVNHQIKTIIIPRNHKFKFGQKDLEKFNDLDSQFAAYISQLIEPLYLNEILAVYYMSRPRSFELKPVQVEISKSSTCAARVEFVEHAGSSVFLVESINYQNLPGLILESINSAQKVALIRPI